MSIIFSWRPFFRDEARERGGKHQAAGRVQRRVPFDDELVRATVEDDEGRTVTIGQEGAAAAAHCTCAAFAGGRYCEHIWATLLEVQYGEDASSPAREALESLGVRPPKARKRAASGGPGALGRAGRPSPAKEPDWVSRLTLLSSSRKSSSGDGDDVSDLLPPQRQVGYVVLTAASHRHGGVVVELRQRTPTATGGWSGFKPLRLAAESLGDVGDAEDRELCALIIGAQQIEQGELGAAVRRDRPHARFRLPASNRLALLQRMVATGRCLVKVSEGGDAAELPLRWERDGEGHAQAHVNPWVLWLVGEYDEEQLVLRLELRRGHERMPIDRPHLLLGGAAGIVIRPDPSHGDCVVGRFDDRGAAPWISQFRDPRPDRGGSLHVPAGDIPRFLDRLYMLGQLPEIDLPDHLHREEQRVSPTPCLDLFNAGSSAAAASEGPTPTKQQLSANLWFEYGARRVEPLDPSRFVPVASADQPSGQAHDPMTDSEAGEAMEHLPSALTEGQAASLHDDHGAGGNGGGQGLIRRDRRAERQALAEAGSLGVGQIGVGSADAGPRVWGVLPTRLMPAVVRELIGRGWRVTADQRAVGRPGAAAFSVSSGIDWLDLHGGIDYARADGEREQVSLPAILAAVRAGRHTIALGDGSQGLLPDHWLDHHQLLAALGKSRGDHLRFKASQAALLDVLLDEQELTRVDEAFAQLRERLSEKGGLRAPEPLDPAASFRGALRPYQRDGVGWLAFLQHFGMGGILADDMGLGKTIQVLAMLQRRRRDRTQPPGGASPSAKGVDSTSDDAASGPSLIVAPRSLVFNWIDEAKRFTPDLRTAAYTGSPHERGELRQRFDQLDLIVTSYGLLRRDIEQLRAQGFDHVVLDEAQAIKNPDAQAAKAARLLDARHRLALTGTPIENHLGDLWSIFEFLNPGMLGSHTGFGRVVRSATSSAGSPSPVSSRRTMDAAGDDQAAGQGREVQAAALGQVTRALGPFVLRRTKKQVLTELPEKTEQTIVCEMGRAQRQTYEELRRYYRDALLNQVDAGPDARLQATPDAAPDQARAMTGRSNFMILEALLRLRQTACHPALLDETQAEAPSTKLDTLLEMLGDVIDEGGKALVFSQFTSMLGLVRRRLEQAGIPYAYLDGRTRDRKRAIEAFQNDPRVRVFLISLKAGGFGLNLTAAEYVFLLDPWWNPAVEAQAIDRAHRIGQDRRVFAYRMICENTVEQRIVELQDRKRELAEAVIGSDQSAHDMVRQLTRDDLDQLLS